MQIHPLRRVIPRAFLIVALGVSSLGARAAEETASPCRYGAPSRIGTLEDQRLGECSGLADSRRNPGILWAHNDSGDEARLFALDRKGHTRAVLAVQGAQARDWEDIAAGPGPDGKPALYIGDIGNNGRKRTDLAVYCLPEPDLTAAGDTVRSAPATAYPFRYPDGNFDAEALLVHPRTGDIYVITKDAEGESGIYRFPRPLQPGRQVTLARVGALHLREPIRLARMITAADIAPDGRRCVVRTYFAVLEYAAPAGQPFEAAFTHAPLRLIAPPEIQGEAIAYEAAGHGIFTASEGRRAPLHRIPCTAPKESQATANNKGGERR